MEVLESGEQSVLQWDRKLSELSEPGETEALMYHTALLQPLTYIWKQLQDVGLWAKETEEVKTNPDRDSPDPLGFRGIVF
ncbi:cAMP responsive element binding protein 3-like protein [Camelus ferus]|nr:cAMP responsive element binding protein 3-like protein [Camelus ferus]